MLLQCVVCLFGFAVIDNYILINRVYVCVCTYAMTCVEVREEPVRMIALCSVGPRGQTHVVKQAGGYLYPLSHLTSPDVNFVGDKISLFSPG